MAQVTGHADIGSNVKGSLVIHAQTETIVWNEKSYRLCIDWNGKGSWVTEVTL